MTAVTKNEQKCGAINGVDYQSNFLEGKVESVIDNLRHGRVNGDCDVEEPIEMVI